MRFHRFFMGETIDGSSEPVTQKYITRDPVIKQWKNVFRFQTGDMVILLDNSGYEFVSQIVRLANDEAELLIKEKNICKNSPKVALWLCASIIKKDNFEWVVQKGTEIGVSQFFPIISDRSEKKNLNHERLIKIVKEAGEQSGRGVLPVVCETMDLSTCLGEISKDKDVKIYIWDPSGREYDTDKDFETKKTLAFFIGPEGGWTDREIEMFKEKGFEIISFKGKSILRAETASVASSSIALL